MFITSLWEPVPNYNQLAAYDSIMSLGIGLCSLENEFPTPKEVVEAVKNVGFNGSGGFVSYDNHTGTRSEESVRAEVINLLVDISEDTITPSAHTSALVNVSSQEVEVVSPFLFSDGSSKPPPVLPPLTVDVNLVEIGARAFGWAVAGFIILLSVYLSYNVFRYRKKNIIMMAQPVFLCLLCLGAAFMASAIIPMSFQEPMSQKSLDGACQAIPWLFIMGFATAFSSLYCKLRRINKVWCRTHRYRCFAVIRLTRNYCNTGVSRLGRHETRSSQGKRCNPSICCSHYSELCRTACLDSCGTSSMESGKSRQV